MHVRRRSKYSSSRNTDASQNCIYQVLHQQLQIERACAQRFQRTVIRNGINKILYAGDINAVQEERLFLIERCCLCKQPLPIVCHSLCIEIFQMQHPSAAVSLLWSNNEISATSSLEVDDGTYVRLASSTSSSELI